jgi:methylglutaconyl-CoA hydratase
MPDEKDSVPAQTEMPPAVHGTYTAIKLVIRERVARLTLARPAVHNAFDETLIAELTTALRALDADANVRAVVLDGEGESFCAGADLNWMRRMARYDAAANLADARALATMLSTLALLGKPTIACVNGAALGGGVGLVACCDIALGSTAARFGLSEVRLGLIPATIGPYVVRAIGARAAQRYFLTGERFSAGEAERIGLLHEVVDERDLDGRVDEVLKALLAAGPVAQAAAKDLLRALSGRSIDAALVEDTAQRIATLRAGDEAREGVAAFLDKRPAAWLPKAATRVKR